VVVGHFAVKTISILGATGSIGASTLDLLRRSPGQFRCVALTAHDNVTALAASAREFGAALAVTANDDRYHELKQCLSGSGIAVAAGASGLKEAAAAEAELVMSAIVGAAGLHPTLRAIERGATIALANKETLVSAGPVVKKALAASGSRLLPVDSEHNAIFQVFDAARPETVSRVILTASGGPFRTCSKEEMAAKTPDEAVRHPKWSMGAKISVDSATLMNKGLELIEAHQLFPVSPDQLDVVIHPQSVVHSLVEYIDGSMLAQLGSPDMRTPIAYALAWPERMAAPSPRLSLTEVARLEFFAPDLERFPALALAWTALREGGRMPTILNAANEIAVAAFLNRQMGFLEIAETVSRVMDKMGQGPLASLDDVMAVDGEARQLAGALVTRKCAA
jgi:1-deoxy-D-xylulose-5-phosphate reductoisomerase